MDLKEAKEYLNSKGVPVRIVDSNVQDYLKSTMEE